MHVDGTHCMSRAINVRFAFSTHLQTRPATMTTADSADRRSHNRRPLFIRRFAMSGDRSNPARRVQCLWGEREASASTRRATQSEGGENMDENTYRKKLAELVSAIGNIPAEDRAKLEAMASETQARHEKLKQTVCSLQESIDYLRLSIKYLIFDLEATRRENAQLRKLLEDRDAPGE